MPRQREQVDAAGGDVLAHGAGDDVDSLSGKFRKEFLVEEVNLAQIWRSGIFADAIAVAYGSSGVGITFDAEAGNQLNLRLGLLGECVGWANANGCYRGGHAVRITRGASGMVLFKAHASFANCPPLGPL